MEIKYCIECEEYVIVDVEDGHTLFVPDGTGNYEVDFCYGAFASVQPPVNFEKDWDLNLVEPDGDEMFLISRNAEMLLYDFS